MNFNRVAAAAAAVIAAAVPRARAAPLF